MFFSEKRPGKFPASFLQFSMHENVHKIHFESILQSSSFSPRLPRPQKVSFVVVLATLLVAATAWPVDSVQAKGGVISRGIEKVAKLFHRGSQAGADDALARAAARQADEAAEAAAGAATRIEGSAVSRSMTETAEAMATRVPGAAKVLRTGGDEIVELALRHGDDLLRIESRFPGMGRMAAQLYPDPADLARLNRLPDDALSKTLSLANKAENPQTARLLLDAVETQGPGFLKQLSPKVIAAGGLSAGMIIVATGGSTGVYQIGKGVGDAMRASEEFAEKAGSGAMWSGIVFVTIVGSCFGASLIIATMRLISKRQRQLDDKEKPDSQDQGDFNSSTDSGTVLPAGSETTSE